MNAPLLECESLRVDVGGAVAVEGLTLQARGPRLALAGPVSPLFAVLSGAGRVASGAMRCLGRDARTAVAEGSIGLSLRDPALPSEWTVERYLIESGCLAGAGRRAAKDLARGALRSLGLSHLAERRFGTLTVAERRGCTLAAATQDAPAVVVAEAPLDDLDDRGRSWLAEVLERATAGRAWIVSVREVPEAGPERALLDRADEVAVIEAGAVVGQGPLRDLALLDGRVLVSVTRNAAELGRALASRGLDVRVAGADGGFELLEAAASPGEARRLLVRSATPTDTDPILDAALEVDAPVVELIPIGRRGG